MQGPMPPSDPAPQGSRKGRRYPAGAAPRAAPQSLPPSGGKVSRRTPRRMRGLPFPVPLFREGRGKPRPYGVTGNSPYLIGPDTPSGRAHKDGGRTMCAPTNWPKASRRGGFQPPEKPSPLRGEGVTADAVTDEGSFFPRPSHRIGKGGTPRGAYPLSPASPTVPEEKTMV